MASLFKDYPPALDETQLEHIISTIKDWSIAHGLAVRPPGDFLSSSQDPMAIAAIPAPVTLYPSLFPKSCFDEGVAIQKAYNELYARISMDEVWLDTVLNWGRLIEVDDFIENLWKIHLRVKQDGYVQPLALGLFRSDYMVHVEDEKPPTIKQVEFNTISSSFGGLSTQVAALHKYLLHTGVYPANDYLHRGSLQANEAGPALASGLIAAHRGYGPSKSNESLPLCILFVVQEPERNMFDQRHLEYIIQAESIPTFRLPFAQVTKYTQYEVSVLYFRSTYAPDEFASASDWNARYDLERSAAIKCPSILSHLAGSKKVQQVLATPSSPHLRKFLNEADAERLSKSFAAIYPLDDSEPGKEAKAIATDPNKSQGYVLKPQREGGGNNVYRKAIPPFLESLGDQMKWRGHILMELIEPPSQRNFIFRGGLLKGGEVIAELGVFGTCLWNSNGRIEHNENAGYLLRTKGRESEEGGVAAGFGAIDSVCLV